MLVEDSFSFKIGEAKRIIHMLNVRGNLKRKFANIIVVYLSVCNWIVITENNNSKSPICSETGNIFSGNRKEKKSFLN